MSTKGIESDLSMFKFISILIILVALRLVLFYVFPPREEMILNTPNHRVTIFSGIKTHIKEVYSQSLNPEYAGLLMGIVFGDKDINKESIKVFQKTGVLHVVAASGMNVSMLINFLLAFLLLFLKRQKALVVAFVCLLLYVTMADFQPSIVRAAIMGGFALGAGIVGRQNTSFLALLLTAFIMIVWDPTIITSISFILSFAATAGIIFIDPLLKNGLMKKSILEDFRTSFSAQLSTTPIVLFFFGIFSPVAIIVNFLVLWTVAPLMLLGGVAALLSFFPILSKPIVLLCLPLLLYFMSVVNFLSKISPVIMLKNVPWTLVFGYYLILIATVFYIYKRKNAHV